jgi:hypothetical protein
MKTNIKVKSVVAPLVTHEGAPARRINAEYQLRRSVLATFLGEDQFYESGDSIESRIAALVPKVNPAIVSKLAVEARKQFHLRHVPLLLVKEMLKHKEHKKFVAWTLNEVISRPDEITEMMSLYWKNGRCPIANQLKKGLAAAFNRFSEYQLAKYDSNNNAIKLRDVMFLVHPRPSNCGTNFVNKKLRKKYRDRFDLLTNEENLFRKVAQRELETPNTWEVRISDAKGVNVAQVWENLLRENALGGLAFLRNLRNMIEIGVSSERIRDYFVKANFDKVLPFRFITALNYAPQFHAEIESAMMRSIANLPKINGKTVLLVDVSGSMGSQLSKKSENNRLNTAIALAILAKEMFADIAIYKFNDDVTAIPLYVKGFSLRDSIGGPNGGTSLGGAVGYANTLAYDRLIVLTDEQSFSPVPNPLKNSNAYMINVASAKNGVGYGPWVHIDGFSESVLTFMTEYEKLGKDQE